MEKARVGVNGNRNLLVVLLSVGVQAVLQVCIELATSYGYGYIRKQYQTARHGYIHSTYITIEEGKPAKPSKAGEVDISCPLPTASFPFPSFCKWRHRFLPPISSSGPSFFIVAVMLADHQEFVLPLPRCPGKLAAWGLHFPTPLASGMVLING